MVFGAEKGDVKCDEVSSVGGNKVIEVFYSNDIWWLRMEADGSYVHVCLYHTVETAGRFGFCKRPACV